MQSLRPWFERHGDQCPQLVNMYGITETTVHVTYRPITLADLDVGGAASFIGGPIPDLQLYVLDQRQQLAPIGVAGELYVGGAGLAYGYLNRPELTAERFIPNPFSREPGSRLYRSGDLARRLPNGDLDYLGRIDHQVKIRGFRIELGEIEAALAQFPGIRETVVLVHEGQPGAEEMGARLVAYFVANPQNLPTVPELRHFLQQMLPAYMIPAAFVPLARFPLTPNGKLDRKQLLAMPLSSAQSQTGGADDDNAPGTPTAELLAHLWAEALGVDQVSRHANFFDLGGHSLLAVKLAARLRETFQVTLPMAAIFEAPTVAALAAQIEQAQRLTQGKALPSLQPRSKRNSDGDEAPLSYVQQRLWFLHQLEPENPFYQMSGAIRLLGRLDVTALAQGITEIVRRHEALRTTFVESDGQPTQRINPPTPVALRVEDLTHLYRTEREDAVRRLALDAAWQPFDLTGDPMLRVRLWRLADEEHIALFTIHHIVADGWSMEVLIKEIAALYTAFYEGQPSPLAELPIQYADFAEWQRSWLQGDLLAQQVNYWKGQLAGAAPMLALPTDYPRPVTPTYAGATQLILLPNALVDELRALSRREQVTLFMLLLAAFQTLLQRYSDQDDILVGTPIAGRNHPLLEGLIGFFVNTLVLRTDFAGDPPFRQVLHQVRQRCLAAYAHQDAPFEKLVEALQVGGTSNRHALFQVWFQIVERVVGEMALPDLTLQPFDLDTTVPEFDLWLSLTEQADGMAAIMRYSNDLFDDQTIATMLERFKTLLTAIVAEPDMTISALPLVSATENAQLVSSFTADLEAWEATG